MEENLKKKSNTKKIILGSIIGILIGSLLSVSYAFFTYSNTGTNNKLVVGDIYMKYKGNNELDFEGAMPSTTYTAGKYFEFEVSGKNTTTNKDIYYDIVLNHGIDNPKSRTTRLDDKFLKFRLVEVENYGESNETENEIIASRSFNTINNTRLHKTTINKNTTSEVKHIYRLYAWISNDVVIGNVNQDYTETEWANLYASISVTVNGDFTDKEIDLPGELASTKIMSRYNSSGQDGLYAVNTAGNLYDSTDESQTIREYRYSGATPNNYIYFNGNELWRIVGVFNGELKIVKDTAITSVPTDYTHIDPETNETNEFTLKYSETEYGSTLYWNSGYSDWAFSRIQFYLNDTNNENSYLSNINLTYRNLIKTNTTYYLGNVDNSMNFSVFYCYNQERSNKTWTGALGLLYPSDFGYANSTNLWGVNLSSYSANDFKHNNWIFKPNATIGYWWFISPSSNSSVLDIDYRGRIYSDGVSQGGIAVRPTLYLKSDTRIYSGDGSISSPYTLIES